MLGPAFYHFLGILLTWISTKISNIMKLNFSGYHAELCNTNEAKKMGYRQPYGKVACAAERFKERRKPPYVPDPQGCRKA
jgi:hypothetical protein